MSREVLIAVRRFLDVEAEVDNDGLDGYDDDEQDSLDGFIDNDENSQREHGCNVRPSFSSLRKDDAAFEDALEKITARLRNKSLRERVDATYAFDELVSRLPCESDCPIWRVKCLTGAEESAILSLLDKASSKHQLNSAFTPGSIRGWVYLECTMNHAIVTLLKETPGIIQTRGGVHRQNIPASDWIRTLTMKSDSNAAQQGRWVQVRKGVYKGNVGVVVNVEVWGVEVLLVPHLRSLQSSFSEPTFSKVPSKRKRNTIPNMALFDPVYFTHIDGPKPEQQDSNHYYTFAGHHFEYGLIRKKYDLHSISIATCIRLAALSFFLESNHPIIIDTAVPRPVEWEFEVGEPVVIRSSNQEGVVLAVADDYAEVELVNEGHTRVSWSDIYKRFKAGDFVFAMNGERSGSSGWVITVKQGIAHIVEKTVNDMKDGRGQALDHFEIHVNLLNRQPEPFVQTCHLPISDRLMSERLASGLPLPDSGSLRADETPWSDIQVTITCGPFKGFSATVKNVLVNQTTRSGLKVEVQLSHISVSRPFHRELVDYDNIIESNSFHKLYEFEQPRSTLFMPKNLLAAQSIMVTSRSDSSTPFPDIDSSTPAWNASFFTPTALASLSPAWDPSSCIPVVASTSLSPAWDLSSHTPTSRLSCPSPNPSTSTTQNMPIHPILDRRLLNISLELIVNGPGYNNKQLTATLIDLDGRLSIRYLSYRTSKVLQSEWISFKNPTATRDNGLLVVIKGEHCGKLVRRIYHRKHADQIYVILAVVVKVGETETISNERLELGIDSLCVKYEESAQRKAADLLMAPLRRTK